MNVAVKAGGREFNSELAQTFLQHMAGLMIGGKRNILFILEKERIFGIHSFFVFFPFDAIYISEKKIVVDVIRQVPPFTAYAANRRPAKYLLELVEKNGLKVGDRVEW